MNGDFRFELFTENQQVVDLREKLALLYATPFADILFWELYDSTLASHGYYKLFYYEQNVLRHIILFKYTAGKQKKIIVLNREIKISLKSFENICHILFNELEGVQQIIFEKIYEPVPNQLPNIAFEKTSNDVIILDLPQSTDEYLKSLGTNAQKRIKYLLNRIARDFPDIKVHHLEKSDIQFEHVENVVIMNRSRMKTKGMISELTDKECKILHRYFSTSGFGFVCVCEIDGKIIGGTFNSVIGEHAYMHVIAHDNSYNKYSFGQIALFHATKFLIEEKKIKYYHLLLGAQEYKFRHGGVDHDLYTVHVFKNNSIYCLFGKTTRALGVMYRKSRRRAKESKIVYWIYTQINKIKIFNFHR